MKAQLVVAMLIGATGAYATMAACGSGSGGPIQPAAAAPGQDADTIAAAADGAGGGATVAVEQCQPMGDGVYAEHLYPGMAEADLATVRVLGQCAQSGCSDPSSQTMYASAPSGYVSEVPRYVFVKDGAVAVSCNNWSGASTSADIFDQVTFVLP
jgi:hypothetical protein